MSEQEFELMMAQAEARCSGSDRPGYYEGYVRGLRRFYHGPSFGSLNEHEKWLGLAYNSDETMASRGRGYLDGLQGLKPHM